MLGLGNALTRSINFGLVEQTLFSNYPQLGGFGQVGIVSQVTVDETTGIATVWEVLPMSILIPSGNESYYSDTVANAYNYVYTDFEYIKDGTVYDNFTLCDTAISDGFYSYWRDNQDKFDDGFYFFPNQLSRVSSDLILSGGTAINDGTVGSYSNSHIVSTNNMFSVDGQVTYYSVNDVDVSGNFHVLAARSYTIQLQYKDALNIEPIAIATKAVEDLDNDRYEYLRGELNQQSTSITGYVPEVIHGMTGNSSLIVQARNHQILFNVTLNVSADSISDLVLNKLSTVEQPWWNSNEQIFLKCTVGHAGNSDFTFNQLLNIKKGDNPDVVMDFVLPMRKVKQSDINQTLTQYAYLQDGLLAGVNYYKISWVAELDVRQMSSLPFVFAPSGAGFVSVGLEYFDGITVEEIALALANQSIGEWHYDKGFDSPLPSNRWWSVFRIRDLSFFTSARPESEKIDIPVDMQNVTVPMYPNVNYAGAVIDYGKDLDDGDLQWTFKEYIEKVAGAGNDADSDYINR